MARPRLTQAPVSRKLEWECGVWRRWRGRARHRGVRGARLQHQLVTALPEPSNLRPHGSGQCLVEDTGRAGPGCFLRWAGRWWQYQCPQPFWSGSLGPAVVSTQSAVYVHSYVSDCRPSACATVPGSPYPDLSPNSSLHSTHFLHTTDIISPRLGKNFH